MWLKIKFLKFKLSFCFFNYLFSTVLLTASQTFVQLWQAGITLQLQQAGFFHCGSFCCWGTWALGHVSFCACGPWTQQLTPPGSEHRLSTFVSWAQLLCDMWLPGLGIMPVSPALACRFFTTGPAGKPFEFNLLNSSYNNNNTYVSIYLTYHNYVYKLKMIDFDVNFQFSVILHKSFQILT